MLDIWFDSGASWAAVLEGTVRSDSHRFCVLDQKNEENIDTLKYYDI